MTASERMRAVAFDPASRRYQAIKAPVPRATGQDLLVAISAASMNPVDAKMWDRLPRDGTPTVLGYDACGTVLETGADAVGFAPGDRVWYAGDATRAGSHATHQLVDSRIVAKAPPALDDADAAALPLTAITAWEALFDRLGYVPLSDRPQAERLLVINGAGGVGSILLQLARLSGIHATATASRPESRDWCQKMGAAEVVPHEALGDMVPDSIDRILCAHDTDAYFDSMARLVAPQGRIVSIVGSTRPHDLGQLFQKSASFGWEFMFTRPARRTPDMHRQGEILAEIAGLFEAGKLLPTRTVTLEGLSVDTIEAAHARLREGRQIGKIALRW
ncbi:MAG: zinc-binding alcohol dehydrogenase family protein [Paracoccaceae bacterium]